MAGNPDRILEAWSKAHMVRQSPGYEDPAHQLGIAGRSVREGRGDLHKALRPQGGEVNYTRIFAYAASTTRLPDETPAQYAERLHRAEKIKHLIAEAARKARA